MSLSEQYEGPQPSELCILIEGEQFFAGFERGIDINAGEHTRTHTSIHINDVFRFNSLALVFSDRPDCKDGRLSFTFYSHLKNIKEVHVCPTAPQPGTVRGQVRSEIFTHTISQCDFAL